MSYVWVVVRTMSTNACRSSCNVSVTLVWFQSIQLVLKLLHTYIHTYLVVGLCSQYSDWLRAGRSRDWFLVGARFSAPVQTGPGAHPASCTMGTRSFAGVKSGHSVTLTRHPLLVPWSRKGTAIPVLPLWAVQPVQSLSARKRVQFTLHTFMHTCMYKHACVSTYIHTRMKKRTGAHFKIHFAITQGVETFIYPCSHTAHASMLTCVCTLSWFVSWLFWTNVLPQALQRNGLIPLCLFSWLLRPE
jgi:hypothetical protein